MKKIFTLLFIAILGLNNINAATFSSLASGTWSVPATWAVTGVDADGIPDADDDVTVNTGHAVTLITTNNFKSLVVQSGATLSGASGCKLYASGDIAIQGNLSGSSWILLVVANKVCNLSSVSALQVFSQFSIYGVLNILTGTNINNSSASAYVFSGGGVNNSGNYTGIKTLSGTGYWNDLNPQDHSFYSVQSGNWSNPSTWSTNTVPTQNDTITIMSGHTVTLTTTNNFKGLTLQSGATLSGVPGNKLYAYGNLTLQGLLSGSGLVLVIVSGKVCNLSSVNTMTNVGTFSIYGTLNVMSGTTINNTATTAFVFNGGKINNSGVYRGVLSLQGNGAWNNLPASTLTLTSASGLTSNVSFTAQPNTVVYATSAGTVCPTTFYNLTLNSGSTKTLSGNITVLNDLRFESVTNNVLNAQNFDINVGGSWINNSTYSVTNQGTITFNGSSAQSITGTNASAFNTVVLSNSAGLTVNSPSITISDALTVSNGNFNANGKTYLLSDASKTARLGTVGAGGSFSGSMTIQKHISARVANNHDLSSPVSNSTIMDWDDDLYMSGIGPDDGTPGPAGVDGTSGSDSSVWIWNESTAAYNAVTGSATPLVVGKGYEIFVADDATSWAARTIDTKGTPNFGTKTINLSYSASAGAYAGVNLIGNPYASSVNYASCVQTNITGNILILDNSGNYTDYGANPVIPPLQGFWITAAGAGASLEFTEASKSNVTATNFYRTKPNYGIKLVFSSQMLPFYNENTINFEPNTNLGYDRDMDALYIKSPNKNAPAMYMLTNSDAKLITNSINSEKDEVTIPFAIYTPKDAIYYIEPSVLNTDSYSYVWIENVKTGKKYDLNSSIAISGEAGKTNTDYILRLSKTSHGSQANQSIFDNDLIVFGSENTINLKSVNSSHILTEVSVYDLSGKLVIQEKNTKIEIGQTTQIDISMLPKGVYIVNALDILGHQKTQKIIR